MRFQRDVLKGRLLPGILSVVLCCVGLGAGCAAQNEGSADPRYNPPEPNELPERTSNAKPSSTKPLVFSSRSEYVLVPVIVQDKQHGHVGGLTKDDFVILEAGRTRPIASLEEVRTSPATAASAREAMPGSKAVDGRPNADVKRIAIIALDLINTPNNEQTQARRSIIDLMLHIAERGTLIELLTIHSQGVTVVHDFTEDPQQLLAALRDVQTQLSNGQTVKGSSSAPVLKDALDKTRTRDKGRLLEFANAADTAYARTQDANAAALTLAAFQRIAESVTGIKGRKSLIWITASFPFQIDNKRRLADAAVAQSFEHTMQLLNQANISVYPVDVRGLPTLGWDGSEHLPVGAAAGPALQQTLSAISVANSSRLSTMLQVAEMTGGQAYFNRNDIDNRVMQGLQDGADYYMLSYPLDKANVKPGWRDLVVRTKGGYSVRARRGFYVTPATLDPSLTRTYDLDNALASPLPFTSLPLRASMIGEPQDWQKGKLLTFEMDLPPGAISFENKDALLNLDFRITATDAHGVRIGGIAQSVNSGLTPESVATLQKEGVKYKNSFELPPGEYTLHFVIRDNSSGRVGSVITHVKVG